MFLARAMMAACALVVALAATANAQTISISTTPSGSFTHSAGSAMAKVIGDKTKLHAVVQAQALAGHVPVDAGAAEFGMSNSFDATFYVTGTGEYEGQVKRHDSLLQSPLSTCEAPSNSLPPALPRWCGERPRGDSETQHRLHHG
jgi:TRAP-type uncharacterized transport system substrate-binding protein